MILPPPGARVYLACGGTDMRRGFDGLAAQVQTVLARDPHDGALFLFRGKRGDLMKALWWDGQGLCLFSKRLERGRFIWPVTREGSVKLSAAQLSMLLEGLDWRQAGSKLATRARRLKSRGIVTRDRILVAAGASMM